MSKLTQEKIDIPERINGLTHIDDYSFEIAKKTKFEFQIGNFLTYANVEYPTLKGEVDYLILNAQYTNQHQKK